MSLKVIELNDSAVSVSDENGLIVQSPGFALVGDRGLEIGRSAEKQARLRPTSSFNKFWHQLSLEPLGYSVGNIRHFADLAYAHLVHVTEEARLEGDVILAVPGNFTAQQLAILLGLAKQCPFEPIGLVDAALANVVNLVNQPDLLFVDIQLHQALLTRFSMLDGHLQREAIIQIPEAGLENFKNLFMQLATGLFIQQCRFNPQHNAESEQQLYNCLPEWLSQYGENSSSLLMEIKTASAVHQAKLPWETLLQRLAEFYARINQQIASIADRQNTQIVISAALAGLPGFNDSLRRWGEVLVARPETLGQVCYEYRQNIGSDQEGFHLVTKLPLAGSRAMADRRPGAREGATVVNEPTHVLYDSFALPLGKVTVNNASKGGVGRVNGKVIEMPLEGLPAYLGQIEREGNQVSIICGEAGALVNGQRVSGKQRLSLGDRVQFQENGEAIRLISVKDGID